MLDVIATYNCFSCKKTKYGGEEYDGASINSDKFLRCISMFYDLKEDDVSFKKIVGCEDAISDLQEYVAVLKDPTVFHEIGGKLSKGCLIVGPSGTGKTTLARALAREADVDIIELTLANDNFHFKGKVVNVEDIFIPAKIKYPCIVLLDDIDSLSSITISRSSAIQAFLYEMDQINVNDGFVFLATATEIEEVDKIFLKEGRFHKLIKLSKPSLSETKEIFEDILKEIKHDDSVNSDVLARYYTCHTGAEIKQLLHQAATKAAMDKKECVTMAMIEEIADRNRDGPKEKSIARDEKCKEHTAYHEAGHVLVQYLSKDVNPVYKATIVQRATLDTRLTGCVETLSTDDRFHFRDKAQIIANIDVKLGGRAAEELVYGKDRIRTGSTTDLCHATYDANKIVRSFGMGMFLRQTDTACFENQVSEDMKMKLDKEVNDLLMDSYNRVKKMLESHRDQLDLIAMELLQKQTLYGEEIITLIQSIETTNDVDMKNSGGLELAEEFSFTNEG